jgi:hypothetical protein
MQLKGLKYVVDRGILGELEVAHGQQKSAQAWFSLYLTLRLAYQLHTHYNLTQNIHLTSSVSPMMCLWTHDLSYNFTYFPLKHNCLLQQT